MIMNYIEVQRMRKQAADLPNLAGRGTSAWDNDPEFRRLTAGTYSPGAGYYLDRWRTNWPEAPVPQQDPVTRMNIPGIGETGPSGGSKAIKVPTTWQQAQVPRGPIAPAIARSIKSNIVDPAIARHTSTRGMYPRLNATIAASGGSTVPAPAQPLARGLDAVTRASDRIGDAGLDFFGIKPYVNPQNLAVPTKNRPIPSTVGWRARGSKPTTEQSDTQLGSTGLGMASRLAAGRIGQFLKNQR